MKEHPSREELLAFVRGELGGTGAREVVRHLVQQCERCVATTESLAGAQGYDAALDGAFRTARRAVKRQSRESAAAARVAEALATRGLGAFDDVAATVDRLAIVEGLLRRSWELRHENPRAMVQLAGWAFGEAGRLSERKYGVRRVADLRCRAAAELGNALRVADRWTMRSITSSRRRTCSPRARATSCCGSGSSTSRLRSPRTCGSSPWRATP
ncbi:MAG: hypothetical protein QOF89_3579 [Acidobacteriota bacterium]|nr:hypothetical protein [Acidobacteriota bacterium]